MGLTVVQRAEERINWIFNGLEDSSRTLLNIETEGKRQKVTERHLISEVEKDEGGVIEQYLES